MRRAPTRSSGRGFVLLEVLVSLTLFSVGVVAVLASLRGSLGVLGLSESMLHAALVLEDLSTERAFLPSSTREENGTVGEYEWVVHEEPRTVEELLGRPTPVESEDAPSLLEPLHLVTTRISWTERGRTRFVESVQLVAGDQQITPDAHEADTPPPEDMEP